MVFVTKILCYAKIRRMPRKYLQSGFMDSLRIYVKGGSGGNGLPKFGGVGGNGGSVSIVACDSLSLEDVLRVHKSKRISAKHGENSSHNFILGHPGESVKIDVPVGVTVYTDEGRKLGELNEKGDELVVAKGGIGGMHKNGYLGVAGQNYSVRLDLKLIADIGLVGFPNAGKSTLLKAVSHAKPKIASYPFTTIRPNIGQIMYRDLRQISMADLPGLIEGAHANRGMGHTFLKHVERTKLLLLVVDINGFQLSPQHEFRSCLDTIVLLNKELEMYNKDLLDKPAMIIINKMDTEGAAEKYEEIKDRIKNLTDSFGNYSADIRPERALQFDDVMAISAQNSGGDDINLVKQRLRTLLNVHSEMNKEKEKQEQANLHLYKNIKEELREKGPRLV